MFLFSDFSPNVWYFREIAASDGLCGVTYSIIHLRYGHYGGGYPSCRRIFSFHIVWFTGAMSYRREVHHMDTISLCVSILSLVVSAISLGVALAGNKK